MKISRCDDYGEMSRAAAAHIAAGVKAKKDLLLCAATGSSPSGMYLDLIRRSQLDGGLFDRMRIIKLDEWHGVAHDDPMTCEYYLREQVLNPLAITADRYISFSSVAPDPIEECRRIRGEMYRQGGIDICILGLGMNGHIGFNEPAATLDPWCHVARLSDATLRHPMLAHASTKPVHGMTLGIGDILSARKILLLISGRGKEPIIEAFLHGKVTTELPASFTLLHHDLEVFIDEGR